MNEILFSMALWDPPDNTETSHNKSSQKKESANPHKKRRINGVTQNSERSFFYRLLFLDLFNKLEL